MVVLGGRQVAPADAVLMGTGALMLVDGFLPWYGVDIGPFGDFTVKGLSSGALAWLPIVLVVAVGALVAARVFAGRVLPSGAVGPAVLALAGSGLATVLLLLKLLVDSSFTRFGLYVGIVLAAVQAWYAYRAFRASGEVLPAVGRTSRPPAA